MIFRTKDNTIDLLLKVIDSLEVELKQQRLRNDVLVDRLLINKNIAPAVPEVRSKIVEDIIIDDRNDDKVKEAAASMAVVGQDFGEDDALSKEEI